MKFFLNLVFSLSVLFTYAQNFRSPVNWRFKIQNLSDKEADLIFTARIEGDWHLYSSDMPLGNGPIPTSFNFEESKDFKLVGKVKEGTPKEEFDPNFNMKVKYFSKFAEFRQRIAILTNKPFIAKGYLEFMVCNDETCLPPTAVDFQFEVTPPPSAKEESSVPVEQNPIDYIASNTDSSTSVRNAGSTSSEENFISEPESQPTQEIVAAENPEKNSETSFTGLFIFSFLGGLAALLTPCVFPMIPLTVSYFTKKSQNRAQGISNALIYGLSIMILYVGVTYTITRIAGPAAMNAFSTNPFVNLVFFALLVIFAISFFGAFEITLPSSWINKADSASERGGIVGIFFMAFTLALVSFSCTGPIIGTLLFEAFSGGIKGPLIGMTGFSLALAIPFTLFAAFPGWLNSLPRSGGWLNSVKVVLGFVELALAFKFLSTADLVWQSGILLREYFIIIWIAIGLLLTIYLLGFYRLPHDSKTEKIGVGRLLLAVLSLSFTLYLIPGLWGAPLKLISGLTPPMWYTEAPLGKATAATEAKSTEYIEGAHPESCPHGLNCFHDFELGLAYAKKVNKPILLDFTGWGCVNCRKMEEKVWSDPRVLQKLQNDFVLISLYVDERTPLPADKQYYSDILGQKIRNVGNYWAEFQAKHFGTNSQPYYVIVGHENLKPLNKPEAYNTNIEAYLKWMEEGIQNFRSMAAQ
ncbi:thiol:disulfide interchange protein DsbD [Thermaurantimonas aggregans]|uniref:Thiol:disulfide interchange protein DsbD n=1 Tax=Thermaurantimonas aggregans TaxID=2173829 RepID=A0A401XK92_9FLAO|nr:cytochrome c biogenesis protein CcdA [Thermaurantimonas aggregans]MCX8148364.1 protein-disulfide reductase DsbD family protein [Thermaurantimonas aggregans]GCD77446.1 thiol:disulfide interchange protein DsbD [Thermaurantimonas aggregans]